MSPLRVLLVALAVGESTLRRYSHRFSPKTFTQPQLFACLVLKEFLKLDYRGLSVLLKDAPTFRIAIELNKVPHFTTIEKASNQVVSSTFRGSQGRLLNA